jgi:sterol 3beta-glucosyltransferase
MSRIVMVAVGSRGDVAPLTGLGAALRRSGHDVAIAAYTPFADMITDSGSTFLELPAASTTPAAGEEEASPMKGLAAFASPKGMRALASDILGAVADRPADLLLLSPFAEMAGHPLAEARAIPSMGVRLQPLSPTAVHPPAVLGAWSAGTHGNRAAARVVAWVLDRLYGTAVKDVRLQLGLPRRSTRRLRAQRTESEWPVLHGYSAHVAPRPTDWRPGLQVTGYWWPAPDSIWEPPTDLTTFLDDGPPPVFVGFGSMMTTPARAEELSDIIGAAARRAGVRVIVQAGWAHLAVDDDTMLTIGDTPHDWLFPRVAAVAHHCGAGTVAAGIRAGRPAIALPAYGDGPFWAARLNQLGVSAATIDQRHLTAENLGEAIRFAVSDDQIRCRATQLRTMLATEDGTATAVDAIENVLHRST